MENIIVDNFNSKEIEIEEEEDNQEEFENSNEDSNEDEEENEIEEDMDIQEDNIIKYKEKDFSLYDIIDKFKQLKMLKDKRQCPICHNPMAIKENKNYKDKLYWRCKKNGINKHDSKINLRSDSILEKTKTDLRILYFIIFYCFNENKSLKKSYLNTKEFCKDLKIESISISNISKIFLFLRKKIKDRMHHDWENNLMGTNPCENHKACIEIDASKLINYDGHTRWMFGLVDRGNYDIRIFFVNNNRTRDTLLPIVKKNVYTYYNSVINNHDPNEHFPATRIYSDCFLSYQENDFNSSGYILHRVNHSVWFGQGSFHTNNIEGVLSRVKR
jgi:hypothetical protein